MERAVGPGMGACRLAAGTTFKRALGLIFSVAGLMVFLGSASVASASVQTPTIHVLSNRADLISGRDALVSIHVPPRVNRNGVRVYLNGQNITSSFALRANGRFEGLVTGMVIGTNILRARLPDGTQFDFSIIRRALKVE